jgi:hypothetical protein
MIKNPSENKEVPTVGNHTLFSILVWVVVIIYVAGMILIHRTANDFCNVLRKQLGLTLYLFVLRVTGVIGVTAAIIYFGRTILDHFRKLELWLLVIPLLIVADLSLISVPVERMHYLQYGLLTWVIFKATGKQFLAAMLAFSCGVVDESFQYWVLYAHNLKVYFDWNDIGLNLMGVIMVLFFFLPGMNQKRTVIRTSVLASLVLWVAGVLLIVFTLNPDQYLIRKDPYKGVSTFWITTKIGTHYHVMNSLEGLIVLGTVLILIAGYYWPNRLRSS